MTTIKIHADNAILQASETIANDGVIALPTETCYGLSCDATNKKAVEKIYKIKQRSEGMPLSVMFFDLSAAEEYVDFNEQAIDLAATYWPGPITLVLPRKKDKELFGVGEESVGVRVPDHRFCLKLLYQVDLPLVTTSANLSGQDNPYSTEDVLKYFEGQEHKPDLIIDGGKIEKTQPSTIVDLSGKEIKVLREGSIKINSKS